MAKDWSGRGFLREARHLRLGGRFPQSVQFGLNFRCPPKLDLMGGGQVLDGFGVSRHVLPKRVVFKSGHVDAPFGGESSPPRRRGLLRASHLAALVLTFR